ncbi:MAG: RHS repeat-associated core domain-containing protein [Planctomycetes bacterium]|nr:RHS repeat-associated core domain-containing protein [Planctomycetota bacterium]
MTITLSGQPPQTVDYTNEASSARYSYVGAIAPRTTARATWSSTAGHYYLYDFRNRLSQVFELVADSGQSAAAMRSAGGAIVSTSALTQARDDILSRLSGSPVQAIRNASRAERSSSTLRAVVPSPYGSSRAGTTVEAQLVLIAAYGYDPFNRRLVRVVPDADVDARYAYDGWREVEECEPVWEDSTWVAKAQKVMVWGASFSELLSYHRWNGESWDSYMVSQDEQGSVTWLHDADGNEVERVEYDPYGARTVYVPAGGGSYTAVAQSSVGLEVGYTGHRHDPETGLIYARNRYLHTEWGRFMTVDPIGSWADSANLGNPYAYVGNNPASAADPSGQLSLFSTGAGGRGEAYAGGGGGGFGGFGFENISGTGMDGALAGGPPMGPDLGAWVTG